MQALGEQELAPRIGNHPQGQQHTAQAEAEKHPGQQVEGALQVLAFGVHVVGQGNVGDHHQFVGGFEQRRQFVQHLAGQQFRGLRLPPWRALEPGVTQVLDLFQGCLHFRAGYGQVVVDGRITQRRQEAGEHFDTGCQGIAVALPGEYLSGAVQRALQLGPQLVGLPQLAVGIGMGQLADMLVHHQQRGASAGGQRRDQAAENDDGQAAIAPPGKLRGHGDHSRVMRLTCQTVRLK